MERKLENTKVMWLNNLIQLKWYDCLYRTRGYPFGIHFHKIMDIAKFGRIIESHVVLKSQMIKIIGYYETANSFSINFKKYIERNIDKYELKRDKDNGKFIKGTHRESLLFLVGSFDSPIKNEDFNINEILYEPEIVNLEGVNLSLCLDIIKLDDVKCSERYIRKLSWKKYGNIDCNDNKLGKCFCCNESIRFDDSTAEFGHILARSKYGEYTLENIRPICIQCNRGVGGMFTTHMYEYIVTNKMYGLKYLTEKEKFLYSNSEKNRLRMLELVEYITEHLVEKYDIPKNISDIIDIAIKKEKKAV